MPRGGGRRSAPAAARPAPAPSRHAPAPTHAPRAAPPPPAGAPAPQGPGLMGQMMATAGGVAIGSAVGHTIGNMMSGGGGHSEVPAEQAAPSQPVNQQQASYRPCEFELEQFLNCAKNQDLSMCESFNQVLKECRARYGM